MQQQSNECLVCAKHYLRSWSCERIYVFFKSCLHRVYNVVDCGYRRQKTKKKYNSYTIEGFAILKSVTEYPEYIFENYLPFLSSNVACNPFSLPLQGTH